MTNVEEMDAWRSMRDRITDLERAAQEQLKTGGGGGTSGGMDPWQTSVEKRLDSLDRRLGGVEGGVVDIRERLARVETDIRHLPGKGFIVTVVSSSLAIIAGLVLFADRLQKLIGTAG